MVLSRGVEPLNPQSTPSAETCASSGSRAVAVTLAIVLAAAGLWAFHRLGFHRGWSALWVVATIAGGWINIPLSRRSAHLGVNVGGCLIPLAVAGQQTAVMPASSWGPLAAATGLVALLCYSVARPV